MSINCIHCGIEERTGGDLLCDGCRNIQKVKRLEGDKKEMVIKATSSLACIEDYRARIHGLSELLFGAQRLCELIVNSEEGTTIKGPIETMAFELAHRIMHELQGPIRKPEKKLCTHGTCGDCGHMKLYSRDPCERCYHSDINEALPCLYIPKTKEQKRCNNCKLFKPPHECGFLGTGVMNPDSYFCPDHAERTQ